MPKLLQYPGINVRVKDRCGNSAFYMFLRFVHHNHYKYTMRSQIFKVIKLFMCIPGSLKSPINFGKTIIHVIVVWNNPDLLSVILSEKALLLTKVDKDGNTPLHTACGQCGIELLRETKTRNIYLVCLDILLQYINCDTLTLKDTSKLTALHWACRLENDVAVKNLLQHPDLQLNLFDGYGVTPLFETIYKSE